MAATDFKQAKGYPIEDWGVEGAKAECKWIGPWADRREFIDTLLPHLYGYDAPSRLVMLTIHVEGQGECVEAVVEGESDYADAVIEVVYGTPPPGEELAKAKGLDPNKWEFNLDFNVSHQTLPSTETWWLRPDGKRKPTEVNKVRIVCTEELALTRCGASSIPDGAIRRCRGRLNKRAFLGYSVGTVLFLGASTRGVISRLGVSGLTYDLRFAIRSEDWRKEWNAEIDKYLWIVVNKAPPWKYIFKTEDFAGLLA